MYTCICIVHMRPHAAQVLGPGEEAETRDRGARGRGLGAINTNSYYY